MTEVPPTDHNRALNHALAAAEQGHSVIPLSRTKLPAVRSPHRAERPGRPCHGECGQLGHGIHDAASDPATVRALFGAAPWATGYGIACGREPHHLIGVDLDVKNDVDGIAELRRLADKHGFEVPMTVTITTPSGGQHRWLRAPAGHPVPNSVGRLAPGIDIRGTGGYLVGPGSVTVRGSYELTETSSVIAPAPAVLLQLLAPPPPRPRPATLPLSGVQAVALVSFVLDAPTGQRNDRLYWAACRAHETDEHEQLAQALMDAAVHIGLPESEARATVASAYRNARGAK